MQFPKHNNTLLKYMRHGIDCADWYNGTAQRLQEVFEDDAGLFADILAATSPNTSVSGNVTLAMKAYQQLKNGKDFAGFLPIVCKMLAIVKHNYETGEALPFGGEKVQNFARALRGDMSAVVIDRWMLRAFGWKCLTELRIAKMTAWVRRTAQRYGMTPCEVQAAVWCGIKRLEDSSGFSVDKFEAYI